MAAVVNDVDGGGDSTASRTNGMDNQSRMSLRQPSRRPPSHHVCLPYEPRHTQDTPSLKIGAVYSESMEAQPPLTCWEPGSTSWGSQSLLGCQADAAETAKVKSWIECRVLTR